MNINGTNKLAVSKSFVRELNQTEWELVGGGSMGESFNCPTVFCSQTCPTVNCQTATCYTLYCATGGCPTVACA